MKMLRWLPVLLLTLVFAVAVPLPANASPTPDCYVTWDNTNSYYVVGTTSGGSDIGDSCSTLNSALNACDGKDQNSDGLIIQLGSTDIPLQVPEALITSTDNMLISAAYTGSVEIVRNASVKGLTSVTYGLGIPSTATATFEDFIFTNSTSLSASYTAPFYMCYLTGGSLNVATGTTITNNTDYALGIYNHGAGTINFTDGLMSESGSAGAAIYADSPTGTVNFIGGSITSSSASAVISVGKGTANISGGSITANGTAGGTAIWCYTADMTITGGSISAKSVVLVNDSQNLNINGGTFTAAGKGIENHGTINMSNGTITGTETSITVFENKGTANISGGTITAGLKGLCIWNDSGTLNISGGTISAPYANSPYAIGNFGNGQLKISGDAVIRSSVNFVIYNKNSKTDENGSVYITGGSITSDCEGGTVLANVIPGGETIAGTINISGGAITASETSGTGIRNETGSVIMSGGTITGWVAISNGIGSVTMSGGAIIASGAGGTGISNNGSVAMSGGSITASDTSSTENYGILINGGTVNISGGTILSCSTSPNACALEYRSYTGNLGHISITGAATIQAASSYVVILAQYGTTDACDVSLFGKSIYSHYNADVKICGINDSISGTYLLNATNYAGVSVSAANIAGSYLFLAWTSDSARANALGTDNPAVISTLNSSTIYANLCKLPDVLPTNGLLTDTEATLGKITGSISWTPPVSSSNADGYKIYWGSDSWTILASSSNALYTVTGAASTAQPGVSLNVPPEAKYLLIYCYNQAGNSTACLAIPLTVKLKNGSLGTAGDRGIIDLSAGKLYKVTTYDDNDDEVCYYVKADGTLSSLVADAAALTGTEITGLTNGETYLVERDAVKLGSESLGTADNGEITDLAAGKLYKVTTYDDNDDEVYYYVKADGTLSSLASDVAELSGTKIIGLSNGELYYVEEYTKLKLAAGSLGTAGFGEIIGLIPGLKYTISVSIEGEQITRYVTPSGAISDESDWGPLSGTTITGLPNELTFYIAADKVALASDSSGTAGDSEITDLISDTVYKVTVGGTVYYVKADGTLSPAESDAAALSGNAITGLKNGLLYKVEAYTASQADKSALATAINDATNTKSNAVVGELAGQYSQSAVDALNAAITTATNVKNDCTANQSSVEAAVNALNNALSTFAASVVKAPVGSPDEEAKAAVQTAETTPTQGNVDTSQGLVTALPDGAEKTALQGRINAVQDIIKATALAAINAGDANLQDYKIAGITYVTAGNLADVKTALAAAKAIKGSDLAKTEIQNVVNDVVAATVKTYTVTGTINNISNHPVSGATVTLMAGSRQVAQTTSDANGFFSISNVPSGTYNLVISQGDQIITLTKTVSDSDLATGTVTLPDGKKNSLVDVKTGTPDIVVSNLNDFFSSSKFTTDDSDAIAGGGTVEIKLIVEKKDESAATNADSIKTAAGSIRVIGMFLDLTLNKTVTETVYGTVYDPTLIDELDNVLAIEIPLPIELQGKSNYVVYRYHNAEVQTITQTANSDGEYIVVSPDGKSITLYTKKFSTYAIAYTVASTSNTGGGGGRSATVTVPAITADNNPGGEVIISTDKKTVTIVPDEGYIISDVLVDGKSVGAITTYTFTDRENHEISAVFTEKPALPNYVSALPYYMQDGKKVFIGLTAMVDSILKYKAPDGVTVQFEENPKNFTDIDNHWAKANIDFVTEREIFTGTDKNIFSPQTGMTRAMFVAVIGRLYERSYGSITGENTFFDVDTSAYYSPYVAWANENGIIKGIGDNQFAPNTEITREQMAAIMFNLATYLDKAPQSSGMINVTYSDKTNISGWAMNSVAYCQLTGIITGREGGNFVPKDTATRAEVTSVIERFVKEILK